MKISRNQANMGDFTLSQLLGLKPTGGGQKIVWHPNGEKIFFQNSKKDKNSILSINVNNGEIKKISDYKSGSPFLSLPMLTCSSNGDWLAYLNNSNNVKDRKFSNRNEIWLQPTSGGKAIQLTRTNSNINAYTWSKDNETIVFSANLYGFYDIFKVKIRDHKFTRLTDGKRYHVYPTISYDCEKIYFVQLDETWTNHSIMAMNLDGSEIHTVASDNDFFDYHYGRSFGFPIVSYSTNSIIFPSHRSGWINYWRDSLQKEDLKIVYSEESNQTDAELSPDGLKLAFVSNTNGTTRLSEINLNESRSKKELFLPEIGTVSAPSWSPDGNKIAYNYGTPTCPSEIWSVEVASGAKLQLTFFNESSKLKGKLVSPKKISYHSFDNLKISAYLYIPSQRVPAKKFPALVIVHGGPTSQFTDTFRADVQYFIQKGYVVILPNIRGSSGYGKEFEDANYQDFGHKDLRDVLAGVDLLKSLEYVNKNKISIHGTSYGGCMSMSVVCFAPGVFHAAVPHAGYADWLDFNEVQELRHRQLLRYKLGDINQNHQVYKKCSPIYQISNVNTPVFLVNGHGRYPSSDASSKFAEALQQEYKIFEHKVYPNECYYVESEDNLTEMYQDIIGFLDRY